MTIAADTVSPELALGEVYRLLAACFCAPQKEVLLEERVPEQLRQALESVCPAAVEQADDLTRALEVTSQRELEIEYARLFVGPGPLLAPPFGSVYLDGERTVMGPSTLEVAELYEQAGLRMDTGRGDPPDHVAVELEFAYFLVRESARLNGESRADEIDSLQRHFVRQYLLPWVPSFCDDIAAHSESDYFRSLAFILKGFLVGSERQRLSPESQAIDH